MIFALGALALLYLKARTLEHVEYLAHAMHLPCTPTVHTYRAHLPCTPTVHILRLKASTLKPALGIVIDELGNLKNSTGHGREAYDSLGDTLDLLQVSGAYSTRGE